MKPKSRWLFVFLLFGLLIVPNHPAYAGPPSKWDKFLDSVVVVRSSIGEGAGFFVDPEGLLVTNHHVVGEDNTVDIQMRNGAQIKGTVIAVKEDWDLALVSIPIETPDWLEFARPNEGGVGADVIAIGTAKGLSWSVSKGIVSGLRDGGDFNIGDGESVLLIQTDAAINSGNSGGPLILLDVGRVVGVNTISFKKDIAEGISFAVSADNVRATFGKYLKDAEPETVVSAEANAKAALKAWMENPDEAIARLTRKTEPGETENVPQGDTDISLANAKKLTVNNKGAGQLLVITGRAKNHAGKPKSYIRLKGTLHDEDGNILQTRWAYTGNYLMDDELQTFSIKRIESKLNTREGFHRSNVNVPPGHSVTFMIVFDHIPPGAAQWSVNVYSVQ